MIHSGDNVLRRDNSLADASLPNLAEVGVSGNSARLILFFSRIVPMMMIRMPVSLLTTGQKIAMIRAGDCIEGQAEVKRGKE